VSRSIFHFTYSPCICLEEGLFLDEKTLGGMVSERTEVNNAENLKPSALLSQCCHGAVQSERIGIP
jgi:hypothetical protein